jgi:hypothetical protein
VGVDGRCGVHRWLFGLLSLWAPRLSPDAVPCCSRVIHLLLSIGVVPTTPQADTRRGIGARTIAGDLEITWIRAAVWT